MPLDKLDDTNNGNNEGVGGGVGFWDLHLFNLAMLAKQL